MNIQSILSDDIIARSVRGQFVLLSKTSSDVITMNETASFVLEALPAAKSVGDLVNEMMTKFAIDDPEVARAHVGTLLQELRNRKVLRPEVAAQFLDEP